MLDNFQNMKPPKYISFGNNNFSIEFDNTYKVKDYNYSISGKLEKGKFELSSQMKNNFKNNNLDDHVLILNYICSIINGYTMIFILL